MRVLILAILFAMFLSPVMAKEAISMNDPDIDIERFKSLTMELRCQKCQNQEW